MSTGPVDMRNLWQGMVSIFLAQALATGNIEVKGVSTGSVTSSTSMMVLNQSCDTRPGLGADVQCGDRRQETTVGSLLERSAHLVPGAPVPMFKALRPVPERCFLRMCPDCRSCWISVHLPRWDAGCSSSSNGRKCRIPFFKYTGWVNP